MATDRLEREKIFDKLDHNLLVKASAGSGKTTLLVEKLVALVEKKGADPSRIVALTFTKKAAAEFYDRFYKKLQLRTKPDFDYRIDDKHSLLGNPEDEIERQRDLDALKKIDTCFMGTIDAFYQNILNEHPIESGIPSSAIIVEEEQLNSLLAKKFSEYLVNPKYKDLAFFFYNNVGAENFPAIAKMALNNRSFHIKQINHNIGDLLAKYPSILRTYKDGLHVLLKDEDTIAKKSSAKSKEAWEFLNNSIGKFDSLSPTDYLGAKKLFSKLRGNLQYHLEETSPLYHTHDIYAVYSKIFLTPNQNYSRTELTDEPLLDILSYINLIILYYSIEFLNLIKDDLVKTLKDNGMLTFSEATIYLVEMLRKEENRKVIDQIRNRYDYILIDECQDTDILQYEIFFRLAGNNYPTNWKDMDITGGKLFIVGDRKQSIYHFRGADVSTFDEIMQIFDDNKSKGKPFDIVTLTDNYRSKGALIRYFNDVFKETLSSQGYDPIPNSSVSEGEHKYTAYNYKTTSKTKYDDLITIIKDRLNDNYQFKDFMIITSSKESTTEYAKKLLENNIPCYTEGNIDFKITSYLETVLNLFMYIASNRENKIAYLELLSSSLFNFDITKSIDLTEDYLSSIGICSDSLDIWPSNLLEKIACNETVVKTQDILGFEILASLIHLLKIEESSGNINSYNDAVIYIQKILEPSAVERLSLLSANVNAIEIANAHKTKGLQKPIVILAPVGGKEKEPNNAKDGGNLYIFSIKAENSYNIILSNPDKFVWLKSIFEKETTYEEGENQRLLYVAATRAEHYLYIPTVERGGKWDALYKDKNFIIKEPEIKYSELKSPEREQVEVKPFVSIIDSNKGNVEKETFTNIAPSMSECPSKLVAEGDVNSDVTFDESAVIGTLIHKLMEYVVINKNKVLNDDICSYIVKKYNREDLLDKLIEVKNIVYNGGFKQNECPFDDIFNFIQPYKTLTEVPFAYSDNDKIVHGFIDLLIETENEIIIIDYKTGTESIDHSTQLEYYKEAVGRFYNKKVKSFIYYIKYNKEL